MANMPSSCAPPHLYESRFRIPRGRETEGFGLGFAIAKTLVEAHRGQIYAQNLIHGGAQIGLSLPAKALTQSTS